MVKPAAQHDGQLGAEARKIPESVGGGFWVGRVHGFVVEGNGESLSLPLPKVSRILPATYARLRLRCKACGWLRPSPPQRQEPGAEPQSRFRVMRSGARNLSAVRMRSSVILGGSIFPDARSTQPRPVLKSSRSALNTVMSPACGAVNSIVKSRTLRQVSQGKIGHIRRCWNVRFARAHRREGRDARRA